MRTKIICTIGPSSESEEMLRNLLLAVMSVARLNFSHGTHREQQKRIERIRKLAQELDRQVGIIADI
ncbi:MAG TPA: pyruvate kinase, partial [Bacillota bacterium]|nr:pyruvate kinase [Bacillota bacterium]